MAQLGKQDAAKTTSAPTVESELIEKLKDAADLLDRRPIAHPILEEIIQEVQTRITMAPRGTVILLIGVAGVGVTRVARAARDAYRRNSQPFNPYCAIEIVARAPISTKFGWKKFFASSLAALDEPVLGQRRRATESSLRVTTFTETAQFRGADDYRSDLENALLRRGCSVMSVLHADFFLRRMPIEEAPHVLQLFDQLVSVCSHPRVALLSGRPSLLQIIRNDSRGDLCAEVIVVPPLDVRTESGRKAAIEMLAGFEQLLINIIVPNTLTANAEEIIHRIVGATGWVKRAISKAISDILRLKHPRMIVWSDIRKHLPGRRVREQLEAEVREIAEWCEYLDSGETGSPTIALEGKPYAKRKRSGRVGERSPSRDSVGEFGE